MNSHVGIEELSEKLLTAITQLGHIAHEQRNLAEVVAGALLHDASHVLLCELLRLQLQFVGVLVVGRALSGSAAFRKLVLHHKRLLSACY